MSKLVHNWHLYTFHFVSHIEVSDGNIPRPLGAWSLAITFQLDWSSFILFNYIVNASSFNLEFYGMNFACSWK